MNLFQGLLFMSAVVGGALIYKAFNTRSRFIYDPVTQTVLDNASKTISTAITPAPLPAWMTNALK